jgi:soluble P-type ATPase
VPLELKIPGFTKAGRFPDGKITLKHLVMDVNGTLARDGELLPGMVERVRRLEWALEVHLLTADTNDRQVWVDADLQVKRRAKIFKDHAHVGETEQAWKEREVHELGADSVVAIGNGRNDELMLRLAALGIAVIGPEGVAREAQEAADLLVPDPVSALELLFHTNRLKATLRQDTKEPDPK